MNRSGAAPNVLHSRDTRPERFAHPPVEVAHGNPSASTPGKAFTHARAAVAPSRVAGSLLVQSTGGANVVSLDNRADTKVRAVTLGVEQRHVASPGSKSRVNTRPFAAIDGFTTIGILVGRIDRNGSITPFPYTDFTEDIAPGPDGNLWFTDADDHQIGRITPATGIVTVFPGGSGLGITTGPDGNLWFTNNVTNEIDQLNSCGRHHSLLDPDRATPRRPPSRGVAVSTCSLRPPATQPTASRTRRS